MKKNPVLIDDITKYRFPGNLQYSPDGKLLAFHVTRSDVAKNCYKQDVYLVKNGKVNQVTHSLDASVLFFDDNTHLILRRNAEDVKPGETQLFLLDTEGGEAQPWVKLPFPLASLKKVKEGVYVAVGIIDANDPDAYKDSPEERGKKLEALKEEEDYHVVDEIPYWFNGQGYINKKRTALFLVETKPSLQVKRLTAAKFSVEYVLVDGNKVYYTGNVKDRRESRYSKLYCYNVTSKKTTTIYNKLDHSFGGCAQSH